VLAQTPSQILTSVLRCGDEAEWIEFKWNNERPDEIGETISALANSALLEDKQEAYLVWGIQDKTRNIVGTTFAPRQTKIGNQELENWLATQLEPRIDFRFHEFEVSGKPIVLLVILPLSGRPISFKGIASVRVGTYTKKLKDHPEKERALWLKGSQNDFEREIAARDLSGIEISKLLDVPAYFELMLQQAPEQQSSVMERLENEKLLQRAAAERWDITNLGALLFARDLSVFDSVTRKAVRVVVYKGQDRIVTLQEMPPPHLGYAVGFAGIVAYIISQLPTNEHIQEALRRQVRVYPELAVRELVANALIHQDLRERGTSPLIEIFSDRIEFTNPGKPLIDTQRFLDHPPKSRNETMAALMRRLSVCEERGTGIDKVFAQVEFYQLPAPEFSDGENYMRIVMYAPRKLVEMDKRDKIRTCYQHAGLMHVSNRVMTNATLRKRFGIEEQNYSTASRIIRETISAGLIRPSDPENKSRKHATYVPFWA
jgi:predicted HTH transcriptional regulator